MYEDYSQIIFGVVCPALCMLGLLPVGAWLIWSNLRGRQQLDAAQGWPSVSGEIIQSQVAQTAETYDGYATTSYVVDVQYAYQVDNRPYFGRKVTLSDPASYNSAAGAAAITSRYPARKQMKVYYNPSDPAQAVLERSKPGNWKLLALGILALILAACMGCAAAATLAWPYLPV